MANADFPEAMLEMREVQAIGKVQGLDVTTAEIRRAEDIPAAFTALKGQAEALYVTADTLVNNNRARIGTLALDAQLPTVFGFEHNDDNLYMLKTRLELRGGFEVLAAEDSEKGCRLATTEHRDVILMDLEMPDDDRWEAVRRLKNDPQTQDIPIIGMSAHAVESEREKAIATGCDEFDAKPIEFESLVATIRRVLAPHK